MTPNTSTRAKFGSDSKLMQAAGLQAPTVVENTGFVIMTFAIPDKNPDGKKTPGKTPGKTPDLILTSLSDAPGASIPQLAQQLDKSSSAIERAIRKLRSEGKLVRIGPAKGGHWKVPGQP